MDCLIGVVWRSVIVNIVGDSRYFACAKFWNEDRGGNNAKFWNDERGVALCLRNDIERVYFIGNAEGYLSLTTKNFYFF